MPAPQSGRPGTLQLHPIPGERQHGPVVGMHSVTSVPAPPLASQTQLSPVSCRQVGWVLQKHGSSAPKSQHETMSSLDVAHVGPPGISPEPAGRQEHPMESSSQARLLVSAAQALQRARASAAHRWRATHGASASNAG